MDGDDGVWLSGSPGFPVVEEAMGAGLPSGTGSSLPGTAMGAPLTIESSESAMLEGWVELSPVGAFAGRSPDGDDDSDDSNDDARPLAQAGCARATVYAMARSNSTIERRSVVFQKSVGAVCSMYPYSRCDYF